jgi:hypothetical protein
MSSGRAQDWATAAVAHQDDPHLPFGSTHLVRDEISRTAKHDHTNLAHRSQSSDRANLGLRLEQIEDFVELPVKEPG